MEPQPIQPPVPQEPMIPIQPITPQQPTTPVAPSAPLAKNDNAQSVMQSTGFIPPMPTQRPIQVETAPLTRPTNIGIPPMPTTQIPYVSANSVALPQKQRSPFAIVVTITAFLAILAVGGLYVYGSYIYSQQQKTAIPENGFQVTETQIDTPNLNGYESQNSDFQGTDQLFDDAQLVE